MSYRLRPSARADLRDIWRYTAEHWSVDQADRYIGEITSTIERLAAGEVRGRAADHILAGYLRQLAASHVIYYQRVGPDIEVARVLHQGMNPSLHLRS